MRFTNALVSHLSVRTSAVLALGFVLATSVSAQSLRCKGDFAQIGNSKGTILQKCGEPMLKDNFCRPAQPAANSDNTFMAGNTGNIGNAGNTTNITVNACVNVDEWTYNPGFGQFMTMLQFEAGELKSIRYGDRVTR